MQLEDGYGLLGEGHGVRALCFTSDGKTLATLGDDRCNDSERWPQGVAFAGFTFRRQDFPISIMTRLLSPPTDDTWLWAAQQEKGSRRYGVVQIWNLVAALRPRTTDEIDAEARLIAQDLLKALAAKDVILAESRGCRLGAGLSRRGPGAA